MIIINLNYAACKKGVNVAFGKKKNTPGMVFGPNGQPHVFIGNDNIATDITTGTFYTKSGDLIAGSDGSLNTMIGENLVIGTNGAHPIFGPDNGPKTVL